MASLPRLSRVSGKKKQTKPGKKEDCGMHNQQEPNFAVFSQLPLAPHLAELPRLGLFSPDAVALAVQVSVIVSPDLSTAGGGDQVRLRLALPG